MLSKISDIPPEVNIQKQLTNIHISKWLQDDLFHFRWWLLILLIVIFVIVWWILLDKSRIHEISLFLFLSIIANMAINEYGEELILWNFPVDIIPIFPPLTSINFIMLPVIYSIIYQKFRTKKGFLLATAISTLIICFIIDPIFSFAGFMNLVHWNYLYSFPLYLIMAIFISAAVNKILKITQANRDYIK